MKQSEVEVVERKLAEDRGKYYRGTARVRFEHLHFGDLCPRGRDDKIVKYLKDKFNYGCLRLEPQNRIPAVIDLQTLNIAIGASPNSTLDSLLENPKGLVPELKLSLGSCIECLHGRQRFEAAREVLPPKDWWWTIDLYLEGASSALLRTLSEEYSDSINFSDGEIYQKICQYQDDPHHSSDALFAEKRLWARLSKSKRRDLKQLLKNKQLTVGFNALRAVPGLWGGFRIGHKFMALKCDEVNEILHYLDHILKVWTAILGGHRELMQSTDRDTVEALQLRAPGLSGEDLAALKTPFRAGNLFPAIKDPDVRHEIWNNLQKEKRMIPSLWSLFEDIKFLRGPAKIMRRLFGKTKTTVRQAMEDIFNSCGQKDNQLILQASEMSFRVETGRSVDQVKLGYWQLWLYTWRHFTKLIQECPRKEDGEDTPVPEEPDPTTWHYFAALARKLGFESDQIAEMVSSDPDDEKALKTLLMGRCSQHFEYDQNDFERFQSQIAEMYKSAKPIAPTQLKPLLLVDQQGEALQRRCGRTFRRAYEHDRNFLFLDALYNPRQSSGRGISSFYVRAAVFFAFFGRHTTSSPVNANARIETENSPSGSRVEDEMTGLETTLDRQTAPVSPEARIETENSPSGSRVEDEMTGLETTLGRQTAPVSPEARIQTPKEASLQTAPSTQLVLALDRQTVSVSPEARISTNA